MYVCLDTPYLDVCDHIFAHIEDADEIDLSKLPLTL